MSKKKRNNGPVERWVKFDELLSVEVPHLSGWWSDPDSFAELRFKARDDGTILAIAKGFDSGGGPIVCFGVGYGVTAALMAIDAVIQGNRWKVDEPYKGKG